jgi:hypothetical protein
MSNVAHGEASLLGFPDAQNGCRSVPFHYLNLVEACMTAASQLEIAMGGKVIK